MNYFFEFSALCLLFSSALFFLNWWQRKRKYSNLPPGPWGLPVVGYLPFMGELTFETLRQLGDKYGKVFGVQLGAAYTVVINDFDALKEAFNNPAALDRPHLMYEFAPGGLGFLGKNGQEWIDQRRQTMRLLKDIGIGTTPWEKEVEEEVKDFVKFLQGLNGRPTSIIGELGTSVSNNMTSIVIGKRLEMNDPRRKIVDNGVSAVIRVLNHAGIIVSFAQWIKVLAKVGLTWYAGEYKKLVNYNHFVRKEVESRKMVSQNELNKENFIDGYLMEIHRSKEKNVKNSYNEGNLVADAQILMTAGGDTTKSQVMWLFLVAAEHLEIQKRVQEEIDRVLGRDGTLNWFQRNELPYTSATIHESMRWKTVVPLGAAHRTSQDTTIAGYDVPKGSNVISNIYAIHMDPTYWKDPEIFRPERFLDSDGKLKNRVEGYVPFSIGRRNCPGELISMMELFQYFVSVLQKFNIRPEDGIPIDYSGIMEAVYYPKAQNMRFLLRE